MTAKCPVYATHCVEHGFVHGGEAEELRSGIETLTGAGFARTDGEWRAALNRLLDRVDARDSIAFLEAGDEEEGGEAA